MTTGPMTVTDAQIEAMLRTRASEPDAALLGDIVRSVEALRQRRGWLRWPVVRSSGDRWPRSVVLVAALVLLAVGLVGAVVVGRLVNPPPPPMPTYHHNGVILVMHGGLPAQVVNISHDAPADRVQLPLIGNIARLSWSPDGMQFASTNPGAVRVTDIQTGTTHELVVCHSLCVAAWSPDGSEIAVGGGGHIEFLTPDGTSVSSFSIPDKTYAVTWSPDGGRLAFVTDGFTDFTSSAMYIVNRDGSGLRELTEAAAPGTAIFDLAWAPDDSRIAFINTSVFTADAGWTMTLVGINPDGSHRAEIAPAGGCWCLGLSPSGLAWSPDGTTIALGKPGEGLFLVNPDTGEARSIATEWENPAWRPVP